MVLGSEDTLALRLRLSYFPRRLRTDPGLLPALTPEEWRNPLESLRHVSPVGCWDGDLAQLSKDLKEIDTGMTNRIAVVQNAEIRTGLEPEILRKAGMNAWRVEELLSVRGHGEESVVT